MSARRIAVIGGGPAGLRAAEIAAAGGASVTLFEAKASVGRKFLVAGKGGLNLTKNEPAPQFAAHFTGPAQPPDFWPALLAKCDPEALRAWAAGLGVETFAASTGRVYPRALKAAPLLRAWVHRLRGQGVHFATHHRWTGLQMGAPLTLEFLVRNEPRTFSADAVILALGGGSWPETGSDGAWTKTLAQLGVAVAPLQPANCGWGVAWSPALLSQAEGLPLKNIAVRAGDAQAHGELLVTSYGLEGGALYRLGAPLRALAAPQITIDLKPDLTADRLAARLPSRPADSLLATARMGWRLSAAAFALLTECAAGRVFSSALELASFAKNCPLRLLGPRPLAEAISSAGGVAWREVDAALMLHRLPGVFIAGEMLDWEAPTGGYLIHGSFATGTHAAHSALAWLGRN